MHERLLLVATSSQCGLFSFGTYFAFIRVHFFSFIFHFFFFKSFRAFFFRMLTLSHSFILLLIIAFSRVHFFSFIFHFFSFKSFSAFFFGKTFFLIRLFTLPFAFLYSSFNYCFFAQPVSRYQGHALH